MSTVTHAGEEAIVSGVVVCHLRRVQAFATQDSDFKDRREMRAMIWPGSRVPSRRNRLRFCQFLLALRIVDGHVRGNACFDVLADDVEVGALADSIDFFDF